MDEPNEEVFRVTIPLEKQTEPIRSRLNVGKHEMILVVLIASLYIGGVAWLFFNSK